MEEVSSLSHPNRNTLHQLQAPRTPSPSHSNQLPPLDIAACGQPLALHDDYTRPQTPGAPDSKNAPSPLEEEKNFMGSVTDKGVWLHLKLQSSSVQFSTCINNVKQ